MLKIIFFLETFILQCIDQISKFFKEYISITISFYEKYNHIFKGKILFEMN